MNLELWTSFSKKKNSTAHPAVGTGNTVFVKLKDNTSVLHPVFELVSNYAPSCKYAYVPDFGRFYFVEDIEYDTGSTWNLRLTCDPLATFMSVIGNYEGMIKRCSDLSYYNPMIRDELNPPEETITTSSRSDVFGDLFADICYILTLAASAEHFYSSDTKSGFCRSYCLTPTQMVQVAKKFLDLNFLQQLANEFDNPMECVVSCKYVPVKRSEIVGPTPTSEPIYVGGQDLEASGDLVEHRFVAKTVSVTLPNKPQGVGSNTFCDAEPYTTLQAYLPFVGVVPIDYGVVRATWALNVRVCVDVLTGDIVYYIYSDASYTELCATYTGNCASDCPITASGWSAKSYVGGAIAVIGGTALTIGTVASGGALGAVLGGIGAMVGGIGSMAKGAEIHTQVNGSISSALGAQVHTAIIVRMFYKAPVHALTDGNYTFGLPCNKYGKVSSHAGFLLMENPSISIDGTDAERDMINNYMSSGFYYE